MKTSAGILSLICQFLIPGKFPFHAQNNFQFAENSEHSQVHQQVKHKKNQTSSTCGMLSLSNPEHRPFYAVLSPPP